MKRICLFIVISLFSATGFINAQCLFSASFQKPDTSCAKATISLPNTSTAIGPSTYQWDFCAGDLDKTPAGAVSAQVVNSGSRLGVDQAFDGVNYYAFICQGNGDIIRLSFGNSPHNTPTDTNLGNISALTGGAADIKVLKVDTNWYAFISTSGNALVRVDFGTDLANPAPVATAIATSGTLNAPYYIDFVADNGQYYALCANVGNSTLAVIDFSTNILNTTPVSTAYAVTGSAVSVSAVKACDQWYAFVAHIGSGDITRIAFGNSLSNAPQSMTNLTVSGLPPSRKIQVVHDNGKWYGFQLDAGGTQFTRFDFGADIANTAPALVPFFDLGGMFTSGDYSFSLRKFNSQWCGVASNWSSNDIKQFYFPDQCQGNPFSESDDSLALVAYTSGGWQHAELTMTYNGGVTLFADSFYISPAPVISFQYTPPCENRDVQFTNQTTISEGGIANYFWNFNDATPYDTTTHPLHVFALPGTYDVTLIALSTNSCMDSVTVPVKVNTNPVAQFSTTGNLCSGYAIPFNDTSVDTAGTLISWLWDFNDLTTDTLQSTTHSFATAGLYNVLLVVSSTTGCYDSITSPVDVIAGPVTDFTVANTCIGETVLFTNQTTITDTSSLGYQWSFGDADTSTLTDPSHTYISSIADYNVVLIAQSTNGCADTSTQIIHIGNKPQAWFTFSPDTACAGNAITFTDSSFISTGDSITNYYWDFGDNTYDSINKNPTHVFQNSGTYTVSLTAHSPASCDSVITRSVYVIASPQASFTTGNVCLGNAATFTDLSQAPTGTSIVAWQWSFGDSTFATAQDTTHNYTQHGTYNAILQVTSSSGCIDTQSTQVIIYELPDVSFTNSVGCSGNLMSFTDQTLVSTTTVTGWQWNFGDNSAIDTLQHPTHTFTIPNTYNVKLIATTIEGCKDSTSKPIFINLSPDFSIGYTTTCFGSVTSFSYVPITVNPVIQTSWNFGDSTTSVQANPTHIYSSIDTFIVTLTVKDNQTTCSTTHTTPLIVHALPTADFTSTNPCTNVGLQLSDNSTISGGTITNWNWSVNGNAVSNQQNPLLQIATAGNYNIGLIVTSDAGCKDSINSAVNVYDPPVPLFSVTPGYGYPGQASSFISQTVSASSLNWNFGDNTINGIDSIELHAYQDTGVYYVTLIATNVFGCIDSIVKPYRVLIPFLDIAVVNVTSSQQNNLLTITATLMNAGNTDIHNTELKIKVEGVPVVHEFPIIEIPTVSPVMLYTLATRFDVSTNNAPSYICVEAINPNNLPDANESNNELCKELTSEFTLTNITPNPGNSISQINFSIPAKGTISYRLYDADGKMVYDSGDINAAKGYNKLPLNVQSLSGGVYQLRMKYKDSYQVTKFIRN